MPIDGKQLFTVLKGNIVHIIAREADNQPKVDVKQSTLYGVPEGEDARVLAEKARALMSDDRVLMHVALDDVRIETLKGLLAFFAGFIFL